METYQIKWFISFCFGLWCVSGGWVSYIIWDTNQMMKMRSFVCLRCGASGALKIVWFSSVDSVASPPVRDVGMDSPGLVFPGISSSVSASESTITNGKFDNWKDSEIHGEKIMDIMFSMQMFVFFPDSILIVYILIVYWYIYIKQDIKWRYIIYKCIIYKRYKCKIILSSYI